MAASAQPPPPPAPASAPAAGAEESKKASGKERAESRKHPLRSGGDDGPVYASLALPEAQPAHEESAPAKKPKHAPSPFAKPPTKLMKQLKKAVVEWDMIRPRDRLLLGLSGGKDSLALLHCLVEFQKRFAPEERFELACATVDPGTEAYNPRPLIPYLESLGITYHYLDTPIMAMASSGVMRGDSICAFCSRMKRGALYSCCREHGYTTLVLGQHLDDFAESFVMSAFMNGVLRTMKTNYVIDAGDIRVIRPLAYVREKALRDFSYSSGLPVIAENCPACFEAPKERNHVKKMLAREESMFPMLLQNVRRALLPLMEPVVTDFIYTVVEDVEARTSNGAQATAQRAARRKARDEGADKPDAVPKLFGTSAELTTEQSALLASLDERALIAELQRRRQAGRNAMGKAEGAPAVAADSARGDAEYEMELVDAQTNCTAGACRKPPAK